jgi:hypothetical protein
MSPAFSATSSTALERGEVARDRAIPLLLAGAELHELADFRRAEVVLAALPHERWARMPTIQPTQSSKFAFTGREDVEEALGALLAREDAVAPFDPAAQLLQHVVRDVRHDLVVEGAHAFAADLEVEAAVGFQDQSSVFPFAMLPSSARSLPTVPRCGDLNFISSDLMSLRLCESFNLGHEVERAIRLEHS